jgi:toxin-antitoxin system PIN domain toxin
VNVWVALTYSGHSHNQAAWTWFRSLDDSHLLFFCRLTQISLLRLLTTRSVMGGEVMTQDEAWSAYDRWIQDERVFFADEPPDAEEVFRSLSRDAQPNSKKWADDYLAAFSITAGLSFVTFDQAFQGRVADLVLLRS